MFIHWLLFVSNILRSSVESIHIENAGVSVTNHRPVIAIFQRRNMVYSGLENLQREPCNLTRSSQTWRSDKAKLHIYNQTTTVILANLRPPSVCLVCSLEWRSLDQCWLMRKYYVSTVVALSVCMVALQYFSTTGLFVPIKVTKQVVL